MTTIRLLVPRAEADKALHLCKNLSYRILSPCSLNRGHVSVRKVVEVLRTAARNGVEIGHEIPDDLMDVSEIAAATGMTMRRANRVVSRSPHFYITNKVRLMHRGDIEAICG